MIWSFLLFFLFQLNFWQLCVSSFCYFLHFSFIKFWTFTLGKSFKKFLGTFTWGTFINWARSLYVNYLIFPLDHISSNLNQLFFCLRLLLSFLFLSLFKLFDCFLLMRKKRISKRLLTLILPCAPFLLKRLWFKRRISLDSSWILLNKYWSYWEMRRFFLRKSFWNHAHRDKVIMSNFLWNQGRKVLFIDRFVYRRLKICCYFVFRRLMLVSLILLIAKERKLCECWWNLNRLKVINSLSFI